MTHVGITRIDLFPQIKLAYQKIFGVNCTYEYPSLKRNEIIDVYVDGKVSRGAKIKMKWLIHGINASADLFIIEADELKSCEDVIIKKGQKDVI